MTRESQLQASAVKLLSAKLKAYGAVVGVIPNGDGRKTRAPGFTAGEPDLFVIVRGQTHGIELKSEKGTLKPHQRTRHDEWRRAGAVVHVARSLDEIEGIADALICGRAA